MPGRGSCLLAGATLAGYVLGTKLSGEGAARLRQSLWGTVPQPFTMRPASTVGTSVSLLPSPTPNSCSFPELSRLGGGRKRVRPRRQGSDAEARARGEGCVPGGDNGNPPHPYPFLSSRPEDWYVCVWGECQTPGPKGPPCKWLKPPSQKPQLWTGAPPLHLNKALFHHPGASAPLLSSATLPSPQGRPLLVIHQLQPGAPLCGNHRA